MDAWRQWWEMAQESLSVARAAEESGGYRSSASRYYYAAYQAATALLLYRGLTPPQGREAWTHEDTPFLLAFETGTLIRSRDRRNDLAARLRNLYRLRLVADYSARQIVSRTRVERARRNADFLRIVDNILPKR